jgi:DNA-binding NtrC family response regulator
MTESILNGKAILIVDDEVDIGVLVEEEIRQAASDVVVEKATSYDTAASLLHTKTFDLVVLDIMGVRGFDLLQIAVDRGFKVAMLTAHALSPEALKKSHDLGARAYLPKEKLGDLVPFLVDILKLDYSRGWKRLLGKLENYFDDQFEPNWKKEAGINFW